MSDSIQSGRLAHLKESRTAFMLGCKVAWQLTKETACKRDSRNARWSARQAERLFAW